MSPLWGFYAHYNSMLQRCRPSGAFAHWSSILQFITEMSPLCGYCLGSLECEILSDIKDLKMVFRNPNFIYQIEINLIKFS